MFLPNFRLGRSVIGVEIVLDIVVLSLLLLLFVLIDDKVSIYHFASLVRVFDFPYLCFIVEDNDDLDLRPDFV